MGTDLADAVPVNAPLALTSVDACGERSPRCRPYREGKYHPAITGSVVNGVGAQSFMTSSMLPGMVGIVRRYSWRSVETSQGVYDFLVIKSDLAWATAHGAHLS